MVTMASKLPVITGTSAQQMAEAMFGSGIKIVSATYSGDPLSAGIYSGGDKIAPGATPSDTGVILSTGRASDITNASGEANQTASKSFNSKGVDGDGDLNALAGAKTFDASIFEAKFVPDGSVLTMQVTFSSEEYLEYVGSGFNDAVGVWVNGVKAQLTVGDGDISIDNINDKSNSQLFVDNRTDVANTEMDGFTVTLTLKASVSPGKVNTIKIGIADAGDAAYDSNLLIAGDSIQTSLVASDDSFELGMNDKLTVDLLGNDKDLSGGKLTITKINGQPVVEGSVVTLPNGLEIVVNGDGTITVVSDPSDTEGEANFTYEVSNSKGITDVGFVKGSLVPCFVQGALIETSRGPVPVERVRVGDMVRTLDRGFQPVRWCGARRVASAGAMAAVHVPRGMFSATGELWVSPQHRLWVSGLRVELVTGIPETLVKVRHLVRLGVLAQDESGRDVVYHHLLFDRHEIILANGVWSESYLPGPMTLSDRAIRAELVSLFPALAQDGQHGYGTPARQECSLAEAAVLVMQSRASRGFPTEGRALIG